MKRTITKTTQETTATTGLTASSTALPSHAGGRAKAPAATGRSHRSTSILHNTSSELKPDGEFILTIRVKLVDPEHVDSEQPGQAA